MDVDISSPRSIKETQMALSQVILPWAPDSSHPPKFVRVTGLGREVAIVDPRLGGYARSDGSEGWGFRSCPGGQGPAISGIRDSKEEAMKEVDDFLSRYFSMKLLVDPEDPYCDNPTDSHGSFGTRDSYGGCTSTTFAPKQAYTGHII